MQPPDSPKEPFHPRVYHEKIRAKFEATDPKLIVATAYTDGSGHEDGFAGSGFVLIVSGKGPVFGAAAETQSSTERGEFYALLRALSVLETKLNLGKREKEDAALMKNLHVEWITDRESLALAVAINPDTNTSFYKRRTCLDLWASYEYFAQFFQVHALFTPRCTLLGAVKADRFASDSRQTLKNYFLTAIED